MAHITNNETLNRLIEAADESNTHGRLDSVDAVDKFITTMFYPLSLIPHS